MIDRLSHPQPDSDSHEPVARDAPERANVKYQDRINRDPKICGGVAVIKGTRIPLRTILASLADGDRFEDILKSFPTLTADDIRAAIAFAAAQTAEDSPLAARPRAS